jgi:hypothetical protein
VTHNARKQQQKWCIVLQTGIATPHPSTPRSAPNQPQQLNPQSPNFNPMLMNFHIIKAGAPPEET